MHFISFQNVHTLLHEIFVLFLSTLFQSESNFIDSSAVFSTAKKPAKNIQRVVVELEYASKRRRVYV